MKPPALKVVQELAKIHARVYAQDVAAHAVMAVLAAVDVQVHVLDAKPVVVALTFVQEVVVVHVMQDVVMDVIYLACHHAVAHVLKPAQVSQHHQSLYNKWR